MDLEVSFHVFFVNWEFYGNINIGAGLRHSQRLLQVLCSRCSFVCSFVSRLALTDWSEILKQDANVVPLYTKRKSYGIFCEKMDVVDYKTKY